jgi:hypothetical protein
MKRTVAILISLTTVGFGSYVAFGHVVRPPVRMESTELSVAGARTERSGGEPASSIHETAAWRAEMARLHAEVSALREQMAANEASANADAPAVGPEPARRDPAALAQQESAWHEHMADVHADFQSEVMDPRWAPSTASTVQSALDATDAMRDRVRGVECRSRTCRVEIATDDRGAVSKELPIFVQQLAEALPNVQADHVEDGNGHTTMVLYMRH